MSIRWPLPVLDRSRSAARIAMRRVLAGHGVGDGGADHARMGRRCHQSQIATRRLGDRIISRTVARRTGRAKARDRAVDQVGPHLAQLGLARAQLFRHAGPEILDEHIRASDEIVQHGTVVGLRRVERDGALVAIVSLVVGRIEPALEGTERIARARFFHLDDIRAEIRQMHAGGRTGDIGAELDNPDAVQHLHHLAPLIPPSGWRCRGLWHVRHIRLRDRRGGT